MHPFPAKIIHAEGLAVFRDDLIEGGTKRRALDILVNNIAATDIAYAGTIFGHGALALAHSCEAVGKQAQLYLSCNDQNHPMLERIRKTNAIIKRCEALPVEQLYTDINAGYIFPLGFDTPDFHEALVASLKAIDLSAHSEIWCGSVSGTLARAIKTAYSDTPLRVVAVTKSSEGEYRAPEKYHKPAELPPPYPSCPYTDAKVWRFAREHAAADALVWNTAG